MYRQAMRTGASGTRILTDTIDNALKSELTGAQLQENQTRQIYVESEELSTGRHTLLVTNNLQDGWLGIDYFLVAPSQSHLSRAKLPRVAIAGIVAGCAWLLLLFTLAILYWIRRRRRVRVVATCPESPTDASSNHEKGSEDVLKVSWPVVTPFNPATQARTWI
ncbi:hypothetical protein DFP72DRAFT_860301 [Ephemerocybe angulata]|uniref:Uncharacterized protein n=1 Tax=Ephemerocybe angulata TaxID=980116 RepID=A0A8H6H930_9AGAR|nr:hypothetical protein DFP72DRAFT_860301 [Tulosesus angulatus]